MNFFKKFIKPPEAILMIQEHELYARNLPDSADALKRGKVAVAGLGGLGSNIAVMLSRIGVGELLLVDFDKVAPHNLNRQHYNTTHIGELKTVALRVQLELINPFITIKTRCEKVDESNAEEIFADYDIVCEAFDNAESKAILTEIMLRNPRKKVIAGSGMCGADDSNKIKTVRRLERLYVCGDGQPSQFGNVGFMSPRVTICAAHQANLAVRILLGLEK